MYSVCVILFNCLLFCAKGGLCYDCMCVGIYGWTPHKTQIKTIYNKTGAVKKAARIQVKPETDYVNWYVSKCSQSVGYVCASFKNVWDLIQ